MSLSPIVISILSRQIRDMAGHPVEVGQPVPFPDAELIEDVLGRLREHHQEYATATCPDVAARPLRRFNG